MQKSPSPISPTPAHSVENQASLSICLSLLSALETATQKASWLCAQAL